MTSSLESYQPLTPKRISECTILRGGSNSLLASLAEKFSGQAIDDIRLAPAGWSPPCFRSTLGHPVEVTGPGTYRKGASRTLRLLPRSTDDGWAFYRSDLLEMAMPLIECDCRNVSSASRAIVLQRGNPLNAMRMTEHIICQRLGMGVDDLVVESASDDPPLFNDGSIDIVQAMDQAGIVLKNDQPLRYCTVAAPVAILHPNQRGFLLWEPPAIPNDHRLFLDVALDFPNAIGRQRIVMELCEEVFRHGAIARTNCPYHEVLFAKTVGWLCSSYLRRLGYTSRNILVAKKRQYYNTPQPSLDLPSGKSLEAVWHRSCLDLIAALSLINCGRPCGKITSYRAGHLLDTDFVRFLTMQKLLMSQNQA